MSFFKRVFLKIKRFFQHSTIKVTTPVKKPIVKTNKKEFVIVCVVPHTKKRQGADDYNGESEWVKGSRHIDKLVNRIRTTQVGGTAIKVHKLFRNKHKGYSAQCRQVAREARDLKADLVVSFHFNAGGGVGFEVLVARKFTSPTDLEYVFGRSLGDSMRKKYGFTLRHDKGMKKLDSSHNGSGMALAVERNGMSFALLEPAFLDSIHAQSKLIVEKEDLYIDEILKAIIVGVKHWQA